MFYQLKSIHSCVVGKTFHEPQESDFPKVSYKYADFDWIMQQELTDYVKTILAEMESSFERQHKRILVDIKVHELKIGQTPALQFWHIDAVSNPLNKAEEEVHHIFVSNEFCLTEFLDFPLSIDIPETGNIDFDRLLSQKEYKTCVFPIKVPPNTILKYGRHLHRATKSTKSHKRLLIRATETDTILSQNRPFTVTYT